MAIHTALRRIAFFSAAMGRTVGIFSNAPRGSSPAHCVLVAAVTLHVCSRTACLPAAAVAGTEPCVHALSRAQVQACMFQGLGCQSQPVYVRLAGTTAPSSSLQCRRRNGGPTFGAGALPADAGRALRALVATAAAVLAVKRRVNARSVAAGGACGECLAVGSEEWQAVPQLG